MKCVVELTEAEDQTLQQLSVNHKRCDVRTRAAGVLLLGRRVKLTGIASKLGVGGQSVYNWAHAWREHGVCGLLIGHKGGPSPRAVRRHAGHCDESCKHTVHDARANREAHRSRAWRTDAMRTGNVDSST
ncbi:helix-turn-helix domain-containing protein [Paraburkholderia sprentiae]